MWFTSDNAGPAAPAILDAVARANEGYAMPYGNDPLYARVTAQVREIFEAPEAVVHLAATGTAANSLALACLCPPWATVYCHEAAHIEVDECGAPEFYTGGAKLTLIPGEDAKMRPEALEKALSDAAHAGVHNVQPGAVSITQATELGAIHTPEEVARLTAIARTRGLPVHMDGTRFSNAVARLGCTPAELSWKAGVDVLCLGATKCGAMGAEAVILFGEAAERRGWEFELRRKRGGHLFSKMRFISAQMEAYLTDDLWLRLAGHANAMADRLAAGLTGAGARVLNAVGANLLFAEITPDQHRRLQAAGARYYTMSPADPEGSGAGRTKIRLVASFRTTEADVDGFVAALAG
jgi:threonine aldolase